MIITVLFVILQIVARICSPICVIAVIFFLLKGLSCSFAGKRLSFFEWITGIKRCLERFANFLLGKFFLPVLIISLIAVLLTNSAIHQLIGIHNLEMKPDGMYCFYVEAQHSSGRTYILPAQIQVCTESFDTGEGTSTKRTDYYIKKIYFQNGEWLDTNDGERDQIDTSSYFCDDEGSEWVLTLLNQHAYSPYVTETDNATWFDIALLLLQATSFALLLYAWCRKENEVIQ